MQGDTPLSVREALERQCESGECGECLTCCLPEPQVSFADHSYPAFSRKQMLDFAEGAVATSSCTGQALALSVPEILGEQETCACGGGYVNNCSMCDAPPANLIEHREAIRRAVFEAVRVELHNAIRPSAASRVADKATDAILALGSLPLPLGWVGVPIEPTEAMIEAGEQARIDNTDRYFDGSEVARDVVPAIWEAMINVR